MVAFPKVARSRAPRFSSRGITRIMPERHVATHARCFLCDHSFHTVYEVPGLYQWPNLVARKLRRDTYGLTSSHADSVSLVFAVDGSVEVVWNESANIVKFVEEEYDRVRFKIRGVDHRFQRYHPRFSEQGRLTRHVDEKFEEDAKYCGQCVPEKALFFAHVDCWRVAERHDINANQLYRFAVQTKPLLPWRGDKPHNRLRGFFGCVDGLNCETSLGKLLLEMSRRLPPELHEIITADLLQIASLKVRRFGPPIAAVPFSLKAREVLLPQLAAVESQVVPILRGMPSEAASVLDLQPSRSRVGPDSGIFDPESKLFDPVKTLWIRVTNLFGRAYMSEIGFDQGGDGTLSIPVSQHPVTGKSVV